MTKIKRHTTYGIEHDGYDFEVDFEPIDGSVQVKINGDIATVGYLVQDEDGGGEFYFDARDEGEWYGYDCRKHGYKPLEREEVAEKAKENPGRMFWIHKYEHGMVRYYRAGNALTKAVELNDTEPAQAGLYIPDQQWDVSRGAALYIAPNDTPDPAKYCDSAMKEFSDWCNGSIYGVVTQGFTKNSDDSWEPGESNECWGHIGYEWAEEALAEEMK